jgi:4-amino-4-deoxy-L-arabinose transferase-like glycosyltransferase
MWDADQGHDMLVLRSFVRDGVVPLLGPPTSIGDVHHGAAYYFILSPAAWLTGGDSPFAVTLWIALLGIAAIAVTWWLARSMGGPVAGAVAALVMAVSGAAVDQSTFIWNPNIVALTSALAFAGAWAAWAAHRPRWWILAAVGTALTVQAHVLGIVVVPVIGALFLADLRRAPDGQGRRAVLTAGLIGLGAAALTYLPLIVNELSTSGSETQALLAYLGGGGGAGDALALPARLVVVALRVIGWPLAGLVTDQIGAVVIVSVIVVATVVLRWTAAGPLERVAVRWLGLGLAWIVVALAVLAPSLATVVPGLPNDHYHAFADPMVFALVGIGTAAAARAGRRGLTLAGQPASVPLLLAVAGVLVLVGWNLAHQPQSVAPDGSFADAEAETARILETLDGQPFELRSLPDFKTAEAIAYPLVRAGREPAPATPTSSGAVVVLCDPAFEAAIEALCGGPAEDAAVQDRLIAGTLDLAERFRMTPRRVISVYTVPGQIEL